MILTGITFKKQAGAVAVYAIDASYSNDRVGARLIKEIRIESPDSMRTWTFRPKASTLPMKSKPGRRSANSRGHA